MKYVKTFLGAVLAGIAIGIGGTACLAVDNKIVGAVLFTVGLYTICVHGMNLFTGKVGYLPLEKPKYLLTLLIIWLGNLAGTFLTALAINATRMEKLSEAARKLCEVKTGDSYLSLILLGVFCGLLMYAAVEGYKRTQNPLILIFCVAGFILCGFEHCIADMFYFSLANAWSGDTLLRTLAITAGNAAGGVLLPLLGKIKEKTKTETA